MVTKERPEFRRDDFVFKHLLLLWAFKNKSSMCYTDFIDEQYRPFTLFYPDNDSLSLVEQLVDDQQRELSLHLLAIDAVRFKPLFNKYIDAQWDRELIINLMNLDGTLLEHLPPWCKKNKEIVMRAVRQSGPSIKLADKFLQNDLDVALTAFQNNHSVIEDLSPDMKGNKPFMLKVVKSLPCEWYLKYASKELQNDIDIVLNAVRSNPGNIAYANPQLLKDETIRKAAFLTAAALFSESHNKNFREWYQWLDRLYDDDGCLAAVQNAGVVILHANPLLLQDEEVVLTALWHWDDCLDFAWISPGFRLEVVG